MSTPEPDPNATPEPVTTVEWWKATVLSLLFATVGILGALDIWHPTEGQVSAISTAAAVVVATVFPLIAFYVRKQVTPNSKVALTNADVALLRAAGVESTPPPPEDTSHPGPDVAPAASPSAFGSADFSAV
jgi:hypothetical protein